MTVPTPTVRADLGTLVTSPPKNLALASMVSTANDLILVRDTREEPGSLNAMCPSGPMPESHCTKYTISIYTVYKVGEMAPSWYW